MNQRVFKILHKPSGDYRLGKINSWRGDCNTSLNGKVWTARRYVSSHIKHSNFYMTKIDTVDQKDWEVVEYELVEVSRTPVSEWKYQKEIAAQTGPNKKDVFGKEIHVGDTVAVTVNCGNRQDLLVGKVVHANDKSIKFLYGETETKYKYSCRKTEKKAVIIHSTTGTN